MEKWRRKAGEKAGEKEEWRGGEKRAQKQKKTRRNDRSLDKVFMYEDHGNRVHIEQKWGIEQDKLFLSKRWRKGVSLNRTRG